MPCTAAVAICNASEVARSGNGTSLNSVSARVAISDVCSKSGISAIAINRSAAA